MKNCTECKVYPVRAKNRDLCRRCFEIALRDLLREEDKRHAANRVSKTG